MQISLSPLALYTYIHMAESLWHCIGKCSWRDDFQVGRIFHVFPERWCMRISLFSFTTLLCNSITVSFLALWWLQAVQDGRITEDERALCDIFRRKHPDIVDLAHHVEALLKVFCSNLASQTPNSLTPCNLEISYHLSH